MCGAQIFLPLPGTPGRGLGRGASDSREPRALDSTRTLLLSPRTAEPVLTTRLRPIAIGGIASPDSPATWATLVAPRGRELLLVTVLLGTA